MVAEPKPHQTGRKRQNVAKTGNDWDYYYDSYYAAAVAPRLVPPLKRPRLMMTQARSVVKTPPQQQQKNYSSNPQTSVNGCTSPLQFTSTTDQLKIYSNPDILICGNCREMFTDLQELLDHKKSYCKLRFTCKCSSVNGLKTSAQDAASLLCMTCKDSFLSAWDLMVHVQAAHMINIYELGVSKCTNGTQLSSPSTSPVSKEADGDADTAEEEDDIHLAESPGSEKSKENKENDLTDAMDIENGEVVNLNHADASTSITIAHLLNGDLSSE